MNESVLLTGVGGGALTRGKDKENLPDDLDELTHVHMVRDEELGFIQHWKLLLTLVPLYDDLQEPRGDMSSSGEPSLPTYQWTHGHMIGVTHRACRDTSKDIGMALCLFYPPQRNGECWGVTCCHPDTIWFPRAARCGFKCPSNKLIC